MNNNYQFKAGILRNMSFEFGGSLLSIAFQKIDLKFYFEDLTSTNTLLVPYNKKTTIYIVLTILALTWYIGHDHGHESTLRGSTA